MDNAGPAGADVPSVADADAAGDNDPMHSFVNVGGLDPAVVHPWRPLGALACAAYAGVLAEWSNFAPRDANAPAGDSSSHATGIGRTIRFRVGSIYELDAVDPIGVHVEDSPNPAVIPGSGE